MATWAELKEVVGKNLKVMEDDGDVITLGFEFDDGDSQTVIVSLAGNDKIGEWAQVESAFGEIGSVDLEAAVRKASEILCGGVASSGDYVTLRHSTPLANMEPDEILIPINAIVASAAEFKGEFGGKSSDDDADDGDDEEEEEDAK